MRVQSISTAKAREVRFFSDPTRFESLDEFLRSDRCKLRGAIEILYGEFPLHFFYNNRGAQSTFVSFQGAVSNKVESVPAWAGLGITRGIDVNQLLFSDPSLKIDTEIRLAWYAGNTFQQNLQTDITKIISYLCDDSEIVLFGTSGGGFAALEQATRLPGCTVITSNPQTDIFQYFAKTVDRYINTAWGEVEKTELPFNSSVVDAFASVVKAQVIYLQNSGDYNHMQKHFIPFRENVHPDNQIIYLTPYLGVGHVGPSKETLIDLIDKICNPKSFMSTRVLSESVKYNGA